ncbi:MAG TPA: hypothetical protein VD902_11525 [Symbiobacteriaceae bacterium]|nr:hypothetical protein [Symbiobacteriaceae bacterium]
MLNPGGERTDVTAAVSLFTPGLAGTVRAHLPGPAGVRDDSLGTPVLDAALAQAGWQEEVTLELEAEELPGAVPPDGDVRAPGGEEGLALEVSAGDEYGAVVLLQDEAGGLTWHFPLADDDQIAPPTRGGGVLRFRIPRTAVEPPEGQDGGTRSLLGMAARKILKVLLYPLADRVLGSIGDKLAARWEAKNRPYRLRTFTPENYRQEAAEELTEAGWQRLQSGRALLFIHGTFSQAHSGFGGLPVSTMEALHEQYDGRLFAFDHFTLSDSPADNAQRFLEAMPPGTRLELDIICHSRGGLVARTLAEAPPKVEGREFKVRRVVFAGVPNNGTALADGAHIVSFLDRYTSAINLVPIPWVADILGTILVAVELVGHGLLAGLPGLQAMLPGKVSLNRVAGEACEYYALTADFDPVRTAVATVVRRSAQQAAMMAGDALMDAVFGKAANDLVVPTEGVYAPNGSPNFPLPAARIHRFAPADQVTHVGFFQHPLTGDKLIAWLRG